MREPRKRNEALTVLKMLKSTEKPRRRLEFTIPVMSYGHNTKSKTPSRNLTPEQQDRWTHGLYIDCGAKFMSKHYRVCDRRKI
jgi:hypothetical protein